MTETKTNDNPVNPTETKKKPPFVSIAIMIALAYFVISDPGRFGNILLVLIGFGMVIFVHELGHFLAAKAVDIKIDEFAVGFGPVFCGLKKIDRGLRIRFLPKKDSEGKESALFSFVIPTRSQHSGETEYQLRLIPLGGFVKMLGQEDLGADKVSEDPRAFGNKAVWKRVIVISAGVTVNVITGFIVFIAVFANGIELTPAIVGNTIPDMPADKAGILPGDEIIAIDGQTNPRFMALMIAAAFAAKDQTVALKVKHPDGSTETIHVEPEPSDLGIKLFGIEPPRTLTLFSRDQISGDEIIETLDQSNIQPADKIIAINNRPIARYDQLFDALFYRVGQIAPSAVNLTLERKNTDGSLSQHTIDVEISLQPAGEKHHILGLIPRSKIDKVFPDSAAQTAGLKQNDIILAIESINNPTATEIQDVIQNHPNKPVDLVVLRRQEDKGVEVTLQVTPKRSPRKWWQVLLAKQTKPIIGISITVDTEHPIVAETVATDDNSDPLSIPRGATITAFNSTAIHSYRDMVNFVAEYPNIPIRIAYTLPDTTDAKTVTLTPPQKDWTGLAYRPAQDAIRILPSLLVPYEKIYRGKNLTECLRMGADSTYTFIAQSYLTIKGMISGTMSAKSVSGPVGILS
ncbi:MAG: site-2 protease family protein, partial [Planctomycetes bacterium]|nr:site-2 protease family protein [Planctomycetota bacterium]